MLKDLSRWRASVCAIALSMSMCTTEGTETDNPVVDFDATECKTHGTALTLATVARTAAALDADPSAYDGLYCYAWETLEDGGLSIDVINFMGGCYVMWKLGASRVEGSQIDLGVANGYCSIAACGSCPYDFTFEIEGADLSQAAEVQLHQYDCKGGGDFATQPKVVLAIDAQPEGMLCRPQRTVDLEDGCGRAHLPPCAESGSSKFGDCEDDCGEGLACVDSEEQYGDLCYTACELDADCPLEVESCQDGACRLRETF
jgi:hypothetical protein